MLLDLIQETQEIKSKKMADMESDCSEEYISIEGGNDNTQLTNVSDTESIKIGSAIDNVDSGTMVFNNDDTATARLLNSDEYASGTMMVNSDTMNVNGKQIQFKIEFSVKIPLLTLPHLYDFHYQFKINQISLILYKENTHYL